jgi:beta-phosphoglucomutase
VSFEREPVLAAVFDFDGTLADTMPLHYEAYRRAFAECCQAELDEDLFFDTIGGTAREVVPRLAAAVGCTADPGAIHRRKKELLAEVLREAGIPVLESAKLLPVLRPHLRMALATSGSRDGIETMLDRLDWRTYFDVIVTGEDVADGKPSPEPYLLAAERLGVDPARCVAFEDTDAGLRSAEAAGMATFDVRATRARRA